MQHSASLKWKIRNHRVCLPPVRVGVSYCKNYFSPSRVSKCLVTIGWFEMMQFRRKINYLGLTGSSTRVIPYWLSANVKHFSDGAHCSRNDAELMRYNKWKTSCKEKNMLLNKFDDMASMPEAIYFFNFFLMYWIGKFPFNFYEYVHREIS